MRNASTSQADLFGSALPRGLTYRPEFLSVEEETALLAFVRILPLQEAQYRQYVARRRTVNFGFLYDFAKLQAQPAAPIPEELAPLRAKCAAWAGVTPEAFVQSLVAEYRPGAPLGWHRDVPDYEVVVGVSLGSPARLRFRPYPWKPELKSRVFALDVAPRSAYILRDEARWNWQHSVPPVKALRYSITFRTARTTSGPQTRRARGTTERSSRSS